MDETEYAADRPRTADDVGIAFGRGRAGAAAPPPNAPEPTDYSGKNKVCRTRHRNIGFELVRPADLPSRCPSNPPELLKRVSNLRAHDGQPMISGFPRLDKCAERVRIRSFDLESYLLRYQLCQPAIVRVGAAEALPPHCL